MKNKILLLIALTFSVPALVCTPGCTTPASQSTQSTTYKTLETIGVSVDAVMKQAASANKHGQITLAQWNQIANAHADFLEAYRIAVDAGAASASPAPEKVVALSARIAALLAQFLPTPTS